jgi:hypothetical protein
LHPIVFFSAGLRIIFQVPFFVSVLIFLNIAAFHIESSMVVFQSQGTIVECRKTVKALKTGDNLLRETKLKLRCEVEGAILSFRVRNLISFL